MTTAANIAVAIVALLHGYFLVLEVFLWDRPFGRRSFGLTPEFAAASKTLAANQGLCRARAGPAVVTVARRRPYLLVPFYAIFTLLPPTTQGDKP